MKYVGTLLLAGAMIAGCGEKAKEISEAMKTVQEMPKIAENLEQSQNEMEKFMAERAAKGDTVAMPYAELQKFLPTAIDGYKLEGEPSGSQQSMGAFSMSMAEQNWASTSGDTNNPARIHVILSDYGGTGAGYGVAGWRLPSSRRVRTTPKECEPTKRTTPTPTPPKLSARTPRRQP
ncbi:MAG: hypothetical protein UZ07_CHB004001062 [Chlorobi bacterium OLB7]|nr:MAG: hypothetical protein UZ07_CHB004001062 [Chlorobi bacterium OLB7]